MSVTSPTSPHSEWPLTVAGLLKEVRDRGPILIEDLAAFFRVPVWYTRSSSPPPSGQLLGPCLARLAEAGLVKLFERKASAKRKGIGSGSRRTKISASKFTREFLSGVEVELDSRWLPIQRALSASLTDLVMREVGGMMVLPVFGTPAPRQQTMRSAFIVMPFSSESDSVHACIRDVLLRCNFQTHRADDIFGPGYVMQDVWRSICSADLVVADCSGRNPNVFYEIAIAHTVGVPTILLTREIDDVPFDIRHRRVVPYRAERLDQLGVSLEIAVRETTSERMTDPFRESLLPPLRR